MSGMLIGILVARTVSGLLAELGGWRLPFALAATVTLVLIVAMRLLLPANRGDSTLKYGALLKSVLSLIGEEQVLRRRMVYGATGMAGFSVIWTALTFLLVDNYGYSEATIGLFGLFGIIGAGSAQLAGRAADRGWLNRATGVFVVLVLLSWGLLAFGGSSIPALIAGIVLLDFGIQGQHISNQSAIYARRPQSRSRMTTAYMTSNFIWGAVGSAAASVAYSAGGWSAVVVLGAFFAAIAVLNWVQEQVVRRRSTAVSAA
jgi:predicted MFS family arabinose efflux permease